MFPALIHVILLQLPVPLTLFVLHLHLSLLSHVFVYPVPQDQQVILVQRVILEQQEMLDPRVQEE